jgi:hypothetical protein
MVLNIVSRSGKAIEVEAPRTPGVSDYGFTGKVTLTPAIAKKYRRVNVSTAPDFLQDQQAQMSLAVQATAGQNPLLDHDTVRRTYLGQNDTTGIAKRIMEQQLTSQVLPVWVTQYLLPLLGVMQQQMGQPGKPGSVPPNGGQPVTTPNTPLTPDATAGVPPTGQGAPSLQGADAINQMLGMGQQPGDAMAMMQGRGTPQGTGQGR